ncbi:SRPBCC domain-containing protein [Modestobacter sp. VKM Ac-2977]|uniref:SRPBCC domain-containing protein n=1 Tax=Modestobacter sp. VKM Ac-2977 TaxID=3004131 RepID=UPI0022AA64E2|nr:SRPBCC domain-containing protein [Modestobacter sp. VKM Ac-2977]MCZ2821629.1 SRPBCC domain-containing protein [Modestobacter sp. VKM Ac-2977]
MQLENAFTVPVPIDEAWRVLLDIERIAPCMPGAALDSVTGDDFTGRVKVKLGPIALTYQGKASFVEKDEAAHRAVIDARGKDQRGNGTAAAVITATLAAEGDTTRVDVLTDLNITGRPAQFGRGVMTDVGNKLLGQFADKLSAQLASGDAEGDASRAAAAVGTQEPTVAGKATAAAAKAAATTAGVVEEAAASVEGAAGDTPAAGAAKKAGAAAKKTAAAAADRAAGAEEAAAQAKAAKKAAPPKSTPATSTPAKAAVPDPLAPPAKSTPAATGTAPAAGDTAPAAGDTAPAAGDAAPFSGTGTVEDQAADVEPASTTAADAPAGGPRKAPSKPPTGTTAPPNRPAGGGPVRSTPSTPRRPVAPAEPEPIDLLEVAGGAALTRYAAPAAGVTVLALLVALLVRRRRR